MKDEVWSIRKDSKGSFCKIVSNRSNWFIAADLLYNHAMTIVTHFNNYGPVKLNNEGEVKDDI